MLPSLHSSRVQLLSWSLWHLLSHVLSALISLREGIRQQRVFQGGLRLQCRGP